MLEAAQDLNFLLNDKKIIHYILLNYINQNLLY